MYYTMIYIRFAIYNDKKPWQRVLSILPNPYCKVSYIKPNLRQKAQTPTTVLTVAAELCVTMQFYAIS